MPRSLRVLSLVLMVATLMTIAGCRKKAPVVVPPPPPPAPPAAVVTPPPPPPPAPQPVVQPAPPAQPTEEEIFARMSLLQLNETRPLDDVFFEFDQSDLSDAGRAVLQKNSTWMRRWTATRVTIEGHADARGTNEYNLALGERRAAVARDYLISLGIPTGRIDTVSKGEEQQACREETESCWAQNRRGHFVVTAK